MGYSGTFHANVGAGFKPAIPRFREPEGGLQTRPYAGWIRTKSAGLGTEADLRRADLGPEGALGYSGTFRTNVGAGLKPAPTRGG